MVKKALFTFLFLIVGYTLFVSYLAPKWWQASQHQWQDNVICAQHYLYDDNSEIENVILGSSLSCRIIADSLPNTYNLSLNGQSIFDGLNVLRHQANVPKNVFIEINVVLREANAEFSHALLSPFLYYPRKAIVSLREDKQPIAIIGSVPKLVKMMLNPNKLEENQFEKAQETDASFFNTMLDIQKKLYSQVPSAELLNNALALLRERVLELEKRGAKVIFFEMPVNSELANMHQATTIRESFYTYFPASKYRYIQPDSFQCKTVDGVHLNPEEAYRYTLYLKSRMQ